MHKDKFIAKISEGSIEIENITDQSVENCIIRIKNVFSVELLIEKHNFLPKEKKYYIFQILIFLRHGKISHYIY